MDLQNLRPKIRSYLRGKFSECGTMTFHQATQGLCITFWDHPKLTKRYGIYPVYFGLPLADDYHLVAFIFHLFTSWKFTPAYDILEGRLTQNRTFTALLFLFSAIASCRDHRLCACDSFYPRYWAGSNPTIWSSVAVVILIMFLAERRQFPYTKATNGRVIDGQGCYWQGSSCSKCSISSRGQCMCRENGEAQLLVGFEFDSGRSYQCVVRNDAAVFLFYPICGTDQSNAALFVRDRRWLKAGMGIDMNGLLKIHAVHHLSYRVMFFVFISFFFAGCIYKSPNWQSTTRSEYIAVNLKTRERHWC